MLQQTPPSRVGAGRGSAARPAAPHPQPPHRQRLPVPRQGRRRSVVSCSVPHPEVPNDDGPSSSSAPSSSSVIPDSLPTISSETDWREFRARLVARNRSQQPGSASTSASATLPSSEWAHGLPNPERGCLLLAHPYMFTKRQTYFNRAVILVIDQDDEKGSWGIVLNKPTKHTVADIVPLAMLCPEFSGNTIFLGGDVGQQSLQMLHQVPNLPDAKEIVSGVFLGGIQAAKQSVAAGKRQPEDFRWFASYAGWAPGQLAQECKKGVWFVAAASPSVVLADMSGPRAPEMAWHRVLQLMGGQYAELSANVRASEEGRPPAGPAALEEQPQRQQQQQKAEEGEGGAAQQGGC